MAILSEKQLFYFSYKEEKMNRENNFHILIVDDTPSVRFLVRALAESMRCNVKEAENGKDALACLRRESFDLVVTDWSMPQMDGIKLTQAIRADVMLADIPVIMFSARNSAEERECALSAGVDEYILKCEKNMNNLLKEKMKKLLHATAE